MINVNDKIAVLLPVFNDWESLLTLLQKIKLKTEQSLFGRINFIIVDDGSTDVFNADQFVNFRYMILQLVRNVGHQRAIAFGLGYVASVNNYSHVLVMDSDGEDKPEHVQLMLDCAFKNNDKVIFAQRSKRSEGASFALFYYLYKAAFYLLTGKKIGFGNFSVIPKSILQKIVYYPEILKHFSGGIVKSQNPFTTLRLERGERLHGKSKMNFVALILHGLSAIGVYIETVSTRIIIFSALLTICLFFGIAVIIYIKYFTNAAYPGWASNVIIGFVIIIFQMFLLSLFITFLALSERLAKQLVPAIDFKNYILKIQSPQSV